MKAKPLILGLVTTIATSAAIAAAHSADAEAATAADFSPTASMIFVTANIGRDYPNPSVVSGAMKRIKDNSWNVADEHPRFIGWQEIDEGDLSGDTADEMGLLKDIYRPEWGWQQTLHRTTADGTREPLHVPEVGHAAQKSGQRVAFGSEGLSGISPTRLITVTRYANQNISHLNTHFISRAFDSCPNNCAERRERWWALWNNLKEQVRIEHTDGFNVVITGDWNRRPVADGWSPADIHTAGRLVKNGGIDHIVAVPRFNWTVIKPKNPDGSFKQGEWSIGIEEAHVAHWVTLRFTQQ